MTLEDFFTLTEMKNGLTTCARVEELICVMQKLSCVTNNVGDAARQWSTAARTLASTQNKECLTLFVHLNGLGFLNHWLQEADKCSKDVADGEELINTLIGSLDKLPMNPEKLRSSGIFTTVEKLFGHTNVNIKERARMLFDKWNNRTANDNGCQEIEKDGSYPVGNFKTSSDIPSIEVKHTVEEVVDNSFAQTSDEGSCKVGSGRIQNLLVTSDNDLQSGNADDVKCSTPSQTFPMLSSIENEHHTLPPTTLVSDSGQENFSVQEGNFIPKAGMVFSTATASPEIQVKDDDPCNASARNDIKAEVNKGRGDSREFRETSNVLSSSGLSVSSDTKNSKVVRSASCNLTLNEGKSTLSDTKETLHRCASVDGAWPEYLKTMKQVKSGEHDSTDLLGSSKGSSCRKEASENTGDIDDSNEPNLNTCEGVDTLMYDNPSKTLKDQATREMEKSSDSEPESGEMDALEIARLVAIEVEREVVDYREELCSSSPEASSNEVMNTGSPCIDEGKQGPPIRGEANGNELVPINEVCDVVSSPKDDNQMLAEFAINPSKQDQILESQNGAAVFQGSKAGSEMGKFDFDLNEDACTEDIDCAVNPVHPSNLVNLSAPIAVSASKGAPLFPTTPLCFEGGLGWRGSAATSAFRPASPRRAFDVEKSESGSKYKSNLIELDLNVTDCENYLPVDAASIKEVPVSSGMPSWNSSSEVSSLRTEKIKLDLNSFGEDEATPSQSPLIKHHFLNRGQSSSPASSSASLRHTPRKNFDLNDNLFSSDAAVSKNINLSKPANPNGVKTEDPVITIMGSRMSLERRADTNQTHQSYIANGLSFDSTLPNGGPMLPYPHQIPHPSYGYFAPGTGMAIPFQPAVYGIGNIPHMVDSRGATVVPQLLSAAGANGTPLATLPYLMNITNTPSSSNGGGPSQPALDLNFGIMQMETGTAEMGNMKHPLMPGHPSLMEEQINGNSLKRKEPDSGWEPYSFGYKHLASWH
ncbi:hypothetical protein M5K25_018611 [Dendrobium thyrsiflorum]|uniref:TFIIS N-terminal domain-containing protein n=1 Tax=Dendrobium thyrsiflorum TaxID=117978 RepID=A0ABD0UQP4_DENTH